MFLPLKIKVIRTKRKKQIPRKILSIFDLKWTVIENIALPQVVLRRYWIVHKNECISVATEALV